MNNLIVFIIVILAFSICIFNLLKHSNFHFLQGGEHITFDILKTKLSDKVAMLNSDRSYLENFNKYIGNVLDKYFDYDDLADEEEDDTEERIQQRKEYARQRSNPTLDDNPDLRFILPDVKQPKECSYSDVMLVKGEYKGQKCPVLMVSVTYEPNTEPFHFGYFISPVTRNCNKIELYYYIRRRDGFARKKFDAEFDVPEPWWKPITPWQHYSHYHPDNNS